MPGTTHPGGIRALGSDPARFFHPSQPIREKQPNDGKRHLTGVLVTKEGMWHVNKKEQMCYLVCINDVDDGSVFHIVKKNLKIHTAPAQPFANEARMQVCTTVPGEAVNPDCSSNQNVTTNIKGGLLRAAMREEIKQLVPENMQAPVPGEAPPPGTWEKPQYCCRCLNANFSNQAGKFVHHQMGRDCGHGQAPTLSHVLPREVDC